MPELFHVLAPLDALAVFRRAVPVRATVETIPTAAALGRFLAADLRAPSSLPSFARSSMDGYAVRAADTYGATEGLPAVLAIAGEVPMGKAPAIAISQGQAALVHTGGPLALGADAVVMVEHTQLVDNTTIEIIRAVPPGENVIQVGEDIRQGDLVLSAGHRVRPQDIGGLTALGITSVAAAKRPRVAILSTGDEIVPPHAAPAPGQVRDVNSYTIAALIERAGGLPLLLGIVPDDPHALRRAAAAALAQCDMLVLSAGSSVSLRDITAGAISALGQPGILVHGVALHPGKPTILAAVDQTPVIGLPGNPVSAMIVFHLFCRPAIAWLSGCPDPPDSPPVQATLARNIASAPGREDFVPVRLEQRDGRLLADPIFGKSNLIYTLVRAQGIVRVPLDKSGLYAGEIVDVRLL